MGGRKIMRNVFYFGPLMVGNDECFILWAMMVGDRRWKVGNIECSMEVGVVGGRNMVNVLHLGPWLVRKWDMLYILGH